MTGVSTGVQIFQQTLRACRSLGKNPMEKGRAKSASYLNDTPGVKGDQNWMVKRKHDIWCPVSFVCNGRWNSRRKSEEN